MTTNMISIFLALAIFIMLMLDIWEKVVEVRNNKAEKKIEPKITVTNPKIIPLKAVSSISPGETPDEFEKRLTNMLIYLAKERNLIDIRVYDDLEHMQRKVEATLNIAKFEEED